MLVVPIFIEFKAVPNFVTKLDLTGLVTKLDLKDLTDLYCSWEYFFGHKSCFNPLEDSLCDLQKNFFQKHIREIFLCNSASEC